MRLYRAPITEITFDDVVQFCKRRMPERENLDYKADFPSHLERVIAAMANTVGGIVIIGVGEENCTPKGPPFEGIPLHGKPEDRVWSIIVDNIDPPVVSAEVRACSPKDGRTFVLIRIPESHETPHTVEHGTRVYVRTGNRNKLAGSGDSLERLATLHEIEWLLRRRRKSEDFRKQLVCRAERRLTNLCRSGPVKPEPQMQAIFAPRYPKDRLMATSELEETYHSITVYDDTKRFPWPEGTQRGVQDGLVQYSVRPDSNELYQFTGLDQFGLIYHWQTMRYETPDGRNVLNQASFVRYLDLMLEVAGKLYQRCGYWGSVFFRLDLAGLLGIPFRSLLKDPVYILEDPPLNLVEDGLHWEQTFSMTDLRDPLWRQATVLRLGQELAWSLGIRMDDVAIKRFMQQRGRWREPE